LRLRNKSPKEKEKGGEGGGSGYPRSLQPEKEKGKGKRGPLDRKEGKGKKKSIANGALISALSAARPAKEKKGRKKFTWCSEKKKKKGGLGCAAMCSHGGSGGDQCQEKRK